jgi:hypothetical protein
MSRAMPSLPQSDAGCPTRASRSQWRRERTVHRVDALGHRPNRRCDHHHGGHATAIVESG